jgi:hypothetical protein
LLTEIGGAVHFQIDCCGDGFGDRLSLMTEMIVGGGGGFVGGGGGFVGGGGGGLVGGGGGFVGGGGVFVGGGGG